MIKGFGLRYEWRGLAEGFNWVFPIGEFVHCYGTVLMFQWDRTWVWMGVGPLMG